jgi:pilus assembly protein FimV
MPAKNKCNAPQRRPGFRLKAAAAAALTVAVFSSAYAAGLGKITVLSGLGQPLNAEIELTSVGRDEAAGLTVRLAPMEAFRQANIELNPALYSLRFAVEQRGGRHVVRITSAQALNEPFIDMLLEVSSVNSKLVREYTFLLDPPELRRPQPAQTAQATQSTEVPAVTQQQDRVDAGPARAPRPARPAATLRPSGEPARMAAPATKQAGGLQADASVQVKRGDTLGVIAAQVRPEGVSLDQMLVALYRANPDAFVGNNMNRLRAGQILKVPDGTAASSVSQGEARGVVVAQAADFNNYRSKLAGQVAVAAPRGAADTGQAAGGKITARVEEQATPANTAKDRLTVSKSGVEQGNAVGAEDKIARDKAQADAQARVRDLEKNIGDLQALLALKNKEMADRQQVAGAATPPAAPAAVAAAPAGSAGAPGATPGAPGSAAALPAAAALGGAPAPAAVVAAAPPKPVVKPKLVAPPPPPEPTLVEELLDNPVLLGAGGLLLALLAAFGLRSAARRRALKKQFSDSAILSESELKTNSMFGATGGQSVDTNNSVFNSSFSPSASQLDTNEVDPVAEADVYIAYGRDTQAEEILKEALRTQPERHSVRVKLLEIYASRKDLRAFDTVASELYSMTKGEGVEWAQAAQLGATIDPKNPLYASSGSTKGVVAAAATLVAARAMGAPAAPAAATGPADLDLDALLNTTSGAHDDGQEEGNVLLFDDAPAPGEPLSAAADAVAAASVPHDDGNMLEFPASPSAQLSMPKAPAAAPADAPAMAAMEPESDGNTLDFEFDLGALDAKAPMDAPFAPSGSADMSLDVPTLAEEAPHAVDAMSVQTSALDFNFDLLKPVETLPSDANAGMVLPYARPTAHDDAAQIELPDDIHAASVLPELPPAPILFDLSSINLDLGTPASAAAAGTIVTAEAGNTVMGSAEMATKLDLALAYQEIGDAEGARELLEEVARGGTPEQVEKATSLIHKMA